MGIKSRQRKGLICTVNVTKQASNPTVKRINGTKRVVPA